MFRIRKIFEHDLIIILRIEGDINNTNLVSWSEEIKVLLKDSEHQFILDGSAVSFITPKAVELFTDILSNDIYLLNFPVNFRNMLHSAGWSSRVLE